MKKSLIYLFTLAPLFGAQAQETVVYADCQAEDFEVIDAEEVNIVSQGTQFIPKCIKVKPGTVVTISASSHHPLQGAQTFNEIPNPFSAEEAHTTAQTRTLTENGFYGYFCVRHADAENGNGMAGLILVSDD